MTKVLQIIDSLARGGGAEQLLVNIVPAMTARGLDVEVCCIWHRDDLAADLEVHGIKVHRLGLDPKERWNIPKVLGRLRRAISESNADVLHANLFFSGLYLSLLPRSFAPGTRVVSLHNVDYDLWPATRADQKAKKQIHGLLYRNQIDRYVSVSHHVAEHYAHHLHLTDLVTIPNAIPTDEISPKGIDRKTVFGRHGVPADGFVCIAPGRLVRQKGHVYLIDAIGSLRKSGLDIELVVAGGGPLADELRQCADRAGIGDHFHLLGILSHPELMELMEASDLVAMPSIYEGFGIVAAEAMALQRPLVATTLGPVEEFVTNEETGLLVPPRDAEALAVAIRRLLEDEPLRRRLSERARERIVADFSTAVIAGRWAEFYRGSASERS